MSYDNAVISQLLKLIPRYEFESLASEYHRGRSFRKASRLFQFVTMAIAQLSGRNFLRDIVENITAQVHRLYHLGSSKSSRTILSRIYEGKPYGLYEALCGHLFAGCQNVAPRHNFRFTNPLYSLDANRINLCLDDCPCANFCSTKGARKLLVGLNYSGYLPKFMRITEGETYDAKAAKRLTLSPGSILVFDKAYNDCEWYNQLENKGIFFVTRLKSNAVYCIIERQETVKSKGITSDQIIEFTGAVRAKRFPLPLRRIGYRDQEIVKHCVFLTNNMKLSSKTIADIYKSRWQVKLFFKWIKQNLKIKSFVGATKNAILTHIWITICVYLLLTLTKFQSNLSLSLQQVIKILEINLFERGDLMTLLRGDPPVYKPHDSLQAKLF